MIYFISEGILLSLAPGYILVFIINERKESSIKTLELIDKQKNAYGNMIYYIRDAEGATAAVFEQDIEDYLTKKGASLLIKGQSYIYRKK